MFSISAGVDDCSALAIAFSISKVDILFHYIHTGEINSMKEYITNHVYDLRTKKGVTQEDVASSIGVSRQTIIAIEKGNYTPSVQLALNLAKFFKVSVEALFKINYEK